MELEFICKPVPTTTESYIRSFINTSFNETNNIKDFETMFNNLLENLSNTDNKFYQDAKLVYRFSKIDTEELIDEIDFLGAKEGFIVHTSPKNFRVICKIKN